MTQNTGINAIETMIQKTNEWLGAIAEKLETKDRHKAYLAMLTVLQALRDRLPLAEVAQLGAQLPTIIRGIYYAGWDPTAEHPAERHKDEFLDRIRHTFRDEPADAEKISRAVLAVLEAHVTPGEIDDVRRVLPPELRELFPTVIH